MKFKAYNEAFNSIVLAENVSEKEFIKAINSYSSIDDALTKLSDEYIEWYMLNINSKTLIKKLKKLNIQGITEEEITLGFGTADKKITKSIKYKGQFITVEYDRDLGSWFPAIRFRSIISALKYIKKQVDYDEQDV